MLNRALLYFPAFSTKLFFFYCELYSPKVNFLINQFLATEALGKNTLALDVGDSLSAVVLYLYMCVNFHKCVSVEF